MVSYTRMADISQPMLSNTLLRGLIMNCNKKECQCKFDKRARQLMVKYPLGITVEQLQNELPVDQERRDVFGRMVYLAQCDKNNEIFKA